VELLLSVLECPLPLMLRVISHELEERPEERPDAWQRRNACPNPSLDDQDDQDRQRARAGEDDGRTDDLRNPGFTTPRGRGRIHLCHGRRGILRSDRTVISGGPCWKDAFATRAQLSFACSPAMCL